MDDDPPTVATVAPVLQTDHPLAAPRTGWLADLGFRRGDLARFGGDVRLEHGALLARHRGADGRPLGWERVWPGPGGGLHYRHSRGGTKGLFRSRVPGARRLVLTCGALPAVAAAACDADRAGSCHAGVGGAWTPAAAAATAALVVGGVSRVVLAFAATAAGEATAARALADLAGLPARVEVLAPPRGTWLATLRQRRRAGEPQA
jgi:hypothetical protein